MEWGAVSVSTAVCHAPALAGDGFHHASVTAHPKAIASAGALGQAALLPESDGTDKTDKECSA